MSKKTRKRVEKEISSSKVSSNQTLIRSVDTENQMRDASRIARANHARRFDGDDILRKRIESFHRQQVEDLRRNRRENQEIARQVYRREDANVAPVDARELDTPYMRRKGMSPKVQYVFRDSRGTIVCVRRRARRAVLFAMRKTGKNSRNRRAKWSDRSYIVCKKVG